MSNEERKFYPILNKACREEFLSYIDNEGFPFTDEYVTYLMSSVNPESRFIGRWLKAIADYKNVSTRIHKIVQMMRDPDADVGGYIRLNKILHFESEYQKALDDYIYEMEEMAEELQIDLVYEGVYRRGKR